MLSDGTLYPLLSRLEREGKLEARWTMPDDAKVPRKYYHLSNEGAALTEEMQRLWQEFSAFVSGAIEESRTDRPLTAPGRNIPSAAR